MRAFKAGSVRHTLSSPLSHRALRQDGGHTRQDGAARRAGSGLPFAHAGRISGRESRDGFVRHSTQRVQRLRAAGLCRRRRVLPGLTMPSAAHRKTVTRLSLHAAALCFVRWERGAGEEAGGRRRSCAFHKACAPDDSIALGSFERPRVRCALPAVIGRCAEHLSASATASPLSFTLTSHLDHPHSPSPPSHLLPPPTSHLSPLTSDLSPPTSQLSLLTSHLSPPTSHLSPLTSHLSPLTSHLPPLTSHLSLLTGTGSHLSSSAGTRARSFATHSGSVGKAARTRASRGAHSWQRENVCGRRQGMTVLDWLHQDNCFASPSKRSGSLSTAIDHSALRDFEGLSTDHVTNGWPWFAVVSNRYQQHSLSFTRVVSQVWDCDVDPATNEGAQ